MNLKKEIKESVLQIRIPADTKRAFKILADRKQTKVSKILLEYIEEEIEKEGISKIIPAENQLSLLESD